MSNPVNRKRWTVMVYLAGDNNLDANGVTDIAEMKKTGSTDEVNIIAQFDRAGVNRPTNRYYMKKGTSAQADVVESLGEINTGKPEFLLDFIKWGIVQYPADHYMLVLWNHGQGWDDTDIFATERLRTRRLSHPGRLRHAFFKTTVEKAAGLSAGNTRIARAILIDDNARDFLDSLELKQVLTSARAYLGRKIDILGMDACLMSMAEVGYQMRGSVRFMVGSEETEPLDGWPYDTILDYLVNHPNITPREFSRIIVKKYIGSYKGTGESVTQSACDMALSSQFAEAVKFLGDSLTAGLSDTGIRDQILIARNRVQEYQVSDNVDLTNLCQLLKNAGVEATITEAADQVIETVKKRKLVISSAFNGSAMKYSNGIAIYFPTRTVSSLYARLDFPKKTGWGRFLNAYINATRSQ